VDQKELRKKLNLFHLVTDKLLKKETILWCNLLEKLQIRQEKKSRKSSGQKKIRFTHEEDLALIKAYHTEKTNWDEIAKLLNNRSGIAARNRFCFFEKKR